MTCAEAPGGVDLRHALLDGTVADDIDNVTNLVLTKVGGQSDHALLLEIAREGCVAESALVFIISHALRITPSAMFLPLIPIHGPQMSSFFLPCPATRCKTDHSECPS